VLREQRAIRYLAAAISAISMMMTQQYQVQGKLSRKLLVKI